MKSIQTKPMLYAFYLSELQGIARDMGYNLVLHGSLNRDCDLVAIPWTNEPRPHLELIQAFHLKLYDASYTEARHYKYSILPGGRHSYVINLNRGGYLNDDGETYSPDPQYYLDISITPYQPQPSNDRIRLTEAQKLQALATRFYNESENRWKPQKGDYYTTPRADLELYQIIDEDVDYFYTVYCDQSKSPGGICTPSKWRKSEFLSGFGTNRFHVGEWVFKF